MVAPGAMPMGMSWGFCVQRGHVNAVAGSGTGRGIVMRQDGHDVPAWPAAPQKKQYETIPATRRS